MKKKIEPDHNNVIQFKLQPSPKATVLSEPFGTAQYRLCKSLAAQYEELSDQTKAVSACLSRMCATLRRKLRQHGFGIKARGTFEPGDEDEFIFDMHALAERSQADWKRAYDELKAAVHRAETLMNLLAIAEEESELPF